MFVLGLQGSPRRKGNSAYLLTALMEAMEGYGARTHVVEIERRHVEPCREYIVCEKKGFCPIDDDMKTEIYARIWEADVVVVASPIFFYNVTAQLKALIDRCQTLWARKYRLRLTDPGRPTRRGFLLSVAATRGKQLFDGVHLTVEYFFDAIGARYEGGLTYRGIEHKGDMEKHSSVREDVRKAADRLTAPFRDRRVVLFAGRNNTGASRMAGAFTRFLAGDRWEALDAGIHPADSPDPSVQKVMHERGIDMGFRNPGSLEHALERALPDRIIDLGAGGSIPEVPGAKVQRWDLPAAAGLPEDRLTALRDEIEKRVREELASTDGNP